MSTALTLTEAQWQELVVEFAKLHGWWPFHVFDSRRSAAGWPDLVLLRPPELVIVELKAEKGRVSPDQARVLDGLRACGIEAAVWRPSDEKEAFARLRRAVP